MEYKIEPTHTAPPDLNDLFEEEHSSEVETNPHQQESSPEFNLNPRGSLQIIGPGVKQAIKEIGTLLKRIKDPRLDYWFEEELILYNLLTWWEIKQLLEENKVNEVVYGLCSTQNRNKQKVYCYIKESKNKQLLNWWRNEKDKFQEEDFKQIFDEIVKGEFDDYLNLNYPIEELPETKPGDLILPSAEEDNEESESEYEEEETESSDTKLKIHVSTPEPNAGNSEQEDSDNNIISRIRRITSPPPIILPINEILIGNRNFESPPYNPNIVFGNFENNPEYDAGSDTSPENKNKKGKKKVGLKVTPTIIPSVPKSIPILTSQIFQQTMGKSSGSSSASNQLTFTNVINSIDNEVEIEVDGIEDEVKNFKVEGMPFYRDIHEEEFWHTPHVKNSRIQQDGKKLRIPWKYFINPSYQSQAYKEQKEKEYQQATADYEKLRRKKIADWNQDEQKQFLEYQAMITERNREVMEQMEMEKKLGETLIDRHKQKKGWSDWLGDPFREQTFFEPDPNERLIFGDNDVAHEEKPEIPSTGDKNQDKWFETMEKVLDRIAPHEYKFVNYPVFNGTQDPYEWLVKFENSCAINHVKNGRKLELLNGCLEGSAQSWWRNIRHMCKRFGGLYDQTRDRKESFKYWFLEQFCGPDKQYEWNQQLRRLEQQPGERVSDYATKLTDLYFRADPQKKYPEYDMLNQFLKGLRRELRVQVRMMQPRNLQEAINKAKAAEMAYSDNQPLAAYSLLGESNEVKNELAEIKALLTLTDNKEVCSLCYGKYGRHDPKDCPNRSVNMAKRQNTEQQKCFNCNQTGHFSKNCPNKRVQQQSTALKCYNCGKEGHMSKNCQQKAAEKCQICGRTNHTALDCRQIRNNNQVSRNLQFNQQNQRSNNFNNNNNRNNSNFNNNRNNDNNYNNNRNNGNNNNRNTNFGNSNNRQGNAYYSQNDINDLLEENRTYQNTIASSMTELANSIKNLKD